MTRRQVVAYITDQSHVTQRHTLPKGAIIGFVTSVYTSDIRGKPVRLLESKWDATRGEAERTAQGYLDYHNRIKSEG